MKIELERKLINVSILDRERNVREVIYHNSSFPIHFTDPIYFIDPIHFIEVLDNYGIKVTIYEIKNNKEFLLFKDISPNLSSNKLIGFKKLKLVFTYRDTSIIDLTNFKFNPKFNWGLIF